MKQIHIYNARICPYCDGPTHVATEKEIYGVKSSGKDLIACNNFPKCNSYVSCDAEGNPNGRLAGPKLRTKRMHTSGALHQLWDNKYLGRRQTYRLLARHLGIERSLCHIGYFSEETLDKVKQWALKQLIERSNYGKPDKT